MAHLTMNRGDDQPIVFTFSGDSTFQVGDTVWFTAKLTHADTDDAAIVHVVSPTDVTLNGATATATIPASATEAFLYETPLVYDWQLRTANGHVHTLDKGRIIVQPDVTRTTTP